MTSTNGGGSDAIVGKLDAAGKYVFGTKFTSTNVTFTGVGVDGAGNLYVDGTFTGTLNFGSGPLTAQNYDLCVAKLGPTGIVIWGKKFGAGGNESATQLVVDAAGNVDVIGNYDAAFNFGLGNLTFVGPSDMFRARLDSNGVVQSSKGWGSGSPIYAQSAIHDSEGHLVIAGSFGGSVDFGNGTITANQTSMFVTTFP